MKICALDMTQNIYIYVQERTSTTHTHTTQNQSSTTLFVARGLPRKCSRSRKLLKFASRQCTNKTKQYVDQLEVWSTLIKCFCDFWLTPTQQQSLQDFLQDLTTNTILVSQPHNSKLTKNSCRIYKQQL